ARAGPPPPPGGGGGGAPARLLQAAQHFPGGPAMLVLALFFAPVGPGIPAGVLLARHVPLHPAATFGLYAVSDVIAAFVCHPIFVMLRRHGRRGRPIRWLRPRLMAVPLLGLPRAAARTTPAPPPPPTLPRRAPAP